VDDDSSAVGGFRHLGDEPIFQGHIWRVVQADFLDPHGETFRRDIVRSPGAVAVVPIFESVDGAHEVVMVHQYRAAFHEYVLEVPAGMRDIEGEAPEDTAQRELAEEVGLRAGSLRLLHSFYPSPGMTDAVLHVFLGTALESVERRAHGPEELDMDVLRMPLRDAVDMVVEGRIKDAKSVIGLLLAERSLVND
jgi:nudix-type nucleoside diphosphatase (YffH/AdpP family)